MHFPRCNLHFSNIAVHFTASTCSAAEDQAASCVSTCGDSNPEQPRCQQQLEFPAEQIHVGASAPTHTHTHCRLNTSKRRGNFSWIVKRSFQCHHATHMVRVQRTTSSTQNPLMLGVKAHRRANARPSVILPSALEEFLMELRIQRRRWGCFALVERR